MSSLSFDDYMQSVQTPKRELSIITVSELTRCVRMVLEAEDLFSDVWIRGEISNLTKHGSGHIYFSLKDEGAIVRCVVWKGSTRSIRFDMSEGMSVVLHGRLTVYERQGQYQLVVDEVKPDGVGALYQAYEELKARLQAEGLFDNSRKKPIPAFPHNIALITSPTAAALRDMVTIAGRRFPGASILLVPTLMQGADSEASVVESLRLADGLADIDVIVVGRGGGSIEDLWTFNTEGVVRAMGACTKPVVSAIGHETDYTLADFVADLRAPTPSAAMELILPDIQEVRGRIASCVDMMNAGLFAVVANQRSRLDAVLRSRCFAHPDSLIQDRWQSVDLLSMRLANSMDRLTTECESRLGEVSAKLNALSPLQVLTRGYAIVRRKSDGQIVGSIDELQTGDMTETILADGTLVSEIKDSLKGWD